MSNLALGTLLKKRAELVNERDKLVSRFNGEISEVETAIEQLAGKKVWDNGTPILYDDEHPEYIRQSQEEI